MHTTKTSSTDKLNSIMSSAKKTVSATQEATESIKSARGEYKSLKSIGKGFSKYEANKSGTVRSISTGAIQMIPTGKKKYLLFNDKGSRSPLDPAEIKALFPKEVKAKRSPVKQIDIDITAVMAKKGVKAIVDMEAKKHYKIYLLNKAGLENKEIAAILDTNTGHVYNELKRYKENPARLNA